MHQKVAISWNRFDIASQWTNHSLASHSIDWIRICIQSKNIFDLLKVIKPFKSTNVIRTIVDPLIGLLSTNSQKLLFLNVSPWPSQTKNSFIWSHFLLKMNPCVVWFGASISHLRFTSKVCTKRDCIFASDNACDISALSPSWENKCQHKTSKSISFGISRDLISQQTTAKYFYRRNFI